MPDNVNITVNETIENVVINPSISTDVIDVNTYSTAETINIAVTPELTTININSVTSAPQVNSDWSATSGFAQILNKPSIPSIAGLATTTYVDTQDALKVDKVAGSRLITTAESTLLGNTSGINTGDQDLSGLTPNTRSISTTTPLQGGGDLSANRTLSILQSNTTQSGFLSNTDWSAFNGKFNLPSLTSGSVLFSNGTTIAQDNANLFWDDTNNRLGIGTITPTAKLHIKAPGALQTDIALRVRDSGDTENLMLLDGRGLLTVKCTSGNQKISFVRNDRVYVGIEVGTNIIGANNSNKLFLYSEGDLPIGLPLTSSVIISDLSNPTSSASAKLRVDSTTQGVLFPRMTTTQKNAIASPATGLVVFDTTLNKLCVRGASAWETITSI